MKKISSAAILFTIILSALSPSFAQDRKGVSTDRADTLSSGKVSPSKAVRRPVAKPSFAEFAKVEAFTDGSGTLVQWVMNSETANIGFFVYRVGEKGLERVNADLVSGSFARMGKETSYSQKYELFDPQGGLNTSYVVEATGQDGSQKSSDTFGVTYTYDMETATGRSAESLKAAVDNPASNIEKTVPTMSRRESAEAVDLTNHRWVVSQPGAKIAVKADGLYRVRLSELQAASNVFNSGNSATWRLFKDGIEQAIIVASDANGLYLEFYGKGIDTVESDTRVFYLIANGVTGKRVTSTSYSVTNLNADSVNYYATTEKKERTNFVNSIFNGDAENWWGRVVINQTTSIPVTLTGIDFSVRKCTVTLRMQSWSLQAPPVVSVVINGHPIRSVYGLNDQLPFLGRFNIPTSYLVEGVNSVQLKSSSGNDYSLFNTFTVNYARKYQAVQNRILVPTPVQQRASITGFTSSNIRVFELNADGEPTLITGLPIEQNGATYTVKWPTMNLTPSTIFGVEDSGILQSPSVTGNSPSTLSAATPVNADLVIISQSDPQFIAAANVWANYRSSAAGGSFNVQVVDVADIFDEYSYGSLSSTAISDFLLHVSQVWPSQIANKQYVLLLSDATYDPRNYLNESTWPFANTNFIPTKNVTTVYNETGSDDALADFNGDGLTDMAIGRIPARNAATITTAYNKTTAFETPTMQSLDRGALFAYDVPNGYDFGSMSQDLSSQLPAAMPKTMVNRGILPTPAPPNSLQADPNAQSVLVNALNSGSTGKYIVNYSGHGATSIWASSTFFGNTTVPSLTNPANQSIYTMLTCLNGYFLEPKQSNESISEALIKTQTGGAVAAWASSGLTTADVQMLMGRQFFNQIGIGNIKRMGDLIRDAKAVLPSGADVRYSWVLIGDPMLKVRQ